MPADKNTQSMYFGGVPTDPDIRRIREEYPDEQLAEGDFIPYSAIEQVIRCEKGSNRYKTVTNRWRGLVEKENQIVIGTRPGEGFVVLTDAEKVDMSGGKLRTAVRQTRRSIVVGSMVDRRKLDPAQKARLAHIEAVNARLAETARLASKGELPTLTE